MTRKKKSSGGDDYEPQRLPVLEAAAQGKTPGRKKKIGDRKGARKQKHKRKHKKAISRAWEDTRFAIGQFIRRLIVPSLIIFGLLATWFFLSQPDIEKLGTATRKPSTIVKTEDGTIIGSYGEIYADYISYENLPQSLVDAVVATEDRNFFDHFGIDPFGIARAIVVNIQAGKTVQGGSTITQQVAKNIFLTPERSLMRKLREAFLALRLESRFTKQEILAIYVNRVYLGSGNYGVDAASRRYFKKSARELSLSESAVLAGLLKAPSRFAPTNNPDLAETRAAQVLLNMVDAGYLKKEEAERARKQLAETIKRTKRNSAESTYYFTDWIMDQLPDLVGNIGKDLVVTSTLKLDLQRVGEAAITKIMDEESEKREAEQAALVSMTPDGAIRAMIGGRSYSESPFNRAVQALRQPGSSFKLFVYLAGLEAGYTPDTIVVDEPITVGKWAPRNYSGKYEGEMKLRTAVAKSINSVAVQVSENAGRNAVVAMARRLGITAELQPDPSIALGSNEVNLLEMTGAYAHLAANGAIVRPYGIIKVESTDGEEIYKHKPTAAGRALNPSIVGMMNSMLRGVVSGGTGARANIGRPAAGKTGTTSDYRDAWFIGYTPDLVTGVWVGNDNNSMMKKVTGGTLPAPIWRDFMHAALGNKPARSLPESSGFSAERLPWERTSPGVIGQPAYPSYAPNGRNAPPAGERKDIQLEKSFWDKLFGPGGSEQRRRPEGQIY